MTLTNFATLVQAYTQPFGSPYLADTDTTNQYLVYSRALQKFTYDTLCNYDDRITFTLATNTYNYSMVDTTTPVVSRLVARPIAVYIGAKKIAGMDSIADLENQPGYQTASAARPRVWALRSPNTLVVWPKADQAYSDSYISGFWMHAPVTTGADVLTIPDIDLEAAAKEVAYWLLEPYSIGSEELGSFLNQLKGALEGQKTEIRKRADHYFNNRITRKRRSKTGRLTR